MSSIDEFRPEDVTEVSDLFMRVFASEGGPAPSRLQDYLLRLHFEKPSYDPDRGCLVQRDATNRIVGFLAGYPLNMRCKGRPLRGVVAGTYMVDPRVKDPFGALRLVRAFMGRRPDVIFSDTANDVARRIWAGLGVATDRLLSMGWARPPSAAPLLAQVLVEGATGPRVRSEERSIASSGCRIWRSWRSREMRSARPCRG